MKSILKKIFTFLAILILYFLPTLIWRADKNFYKSLDLPSYAPSPIVFSIIWAILYVIFAGFLTYKLYNNTLSKETKIAFILNYLVSFFFNLVFFKMNHLFLSFAVTFLSFATGIMIFVSLLKENRYNKAAVTPYLLWTLFASILMGHIYFIN